MRHLGGSGFEISKGGGGGGGKHFCLGTEVPRHSAGCVGTYVRTYVRGTSLFAMRPRKCCKRIHSL